MQKKSKVSIIARSKFAKINQITRNEDWQGLFRPFGKHPNHSRAGFLTCYDDDDDDDARDWESVSCKLGHPDTCQL